MLERDYQAQLIQKLKDRFDGCFVLKNDSSYLQGVPDLLVLYRDKWAMLEVKASLRSAQRANQGYYIQLLDDMSFAAVICPENEEDVLSDLQFAFSARRASRVSRR